MEQEEKKKQAIIEKILLDSKKLRMQRKANIGLNVARKIADKLVKEE